MLRKASRLSFRLSWIFVFAAWPSLAQQSASPQKEPLAVVAGQEISENDLLPQIGGQLRQLRNQEYELKKQALENLVSQKLLQAEAKQQGMTPEKLLEQEVDSKVGEATEEEIEAFYLGQKDRINQPLEQVKAQLAQALKQSKVQKARQDYFQRLRENHAVAILLESPRWEVGYDPARVRGNASAPVTIVEFSDFQCPFCQKAYGVVKELLSKYEGRVKLAYRDFPLRQIHPQAQLAAEASRCAGEQGKFWQYHDRLFESQSKFQKNDLVEHAAGVGLDGAQFGSCLDSGKFRAQVEKDVQDGNQAGVSGTPAFFINGILLSGAQPASAFEKAIESELAALGGKDAAQAGSR